MRVHRRLGGLMAALLVLLVISASLTPGLYPSVAELLKNNPELETYHQVSAQLHSLETLLTSYKLNTKVYPTTEQGLHALEAMPTIPPLPANYHRVLGRTFKDSWNHEFQYRIPGIHNPDGYDVWSLGSDGVSGTEDDIGNW